MKKQPKPKRTPRPNQLECKACRLHESRTQVVRSDGHIGRCDVALIGEAPGEQEDAEGRVFIGRTGKLLRREVEKQTGMIAGTTFPMLNCVSCRPPSNRNPTKKELAACLPWLKLNLCTIKPQFILLVGTVAAQQFLKKSFVKERGIMLTVDNALPIWQELLPTTSYFHIYHPSYIVRQHSQSVDMLWRGDIATFGEEVNDHASL